MTKLEKIKDNWHYETLDNVMYLSTHTNGGVEINIVVEENEDMLTVFNQYFEDFDIDSEVELHRQDKNYCDNFTIRESVKDFEDFVNEWKEKPNFINDKEKMRDYLILSKEEFLKSYSYLTDEEYESTREELQVNEDWRMIFNNGMLEIDTDIYGEENLKYLIELDNLLLQLKDLVNEERFEFNTAETDNLLYRLRLKIKEGE